MDIASFHTVVSVQHYIRRKGSRGHHVWHVIREAKCVVGICSNASTALVVIGTESVVSAASLALSRNSYRQVVIVIARLRARQEVRSTEREVGKSSGGEVDAERWSKAVVFENPPSAVQGTAALPRNVTAVVVVVSLSEALLIQY